MRSCLISLCATIALSLTSTQAVHADPCGMVPPAFAGKQMPIKRIGVQRTYVFHDRGIETIVLRPGFSGKIDEFGMLIPFPSPPAIRKVPDNTFEQIAAAIDPPEIVIDLTPRPIWGGGGGFGGGFGGGGGGGKIVGYERGLNVLLPDQVRVVRQEAIGMYEVAVIEAGSSRALKLWMNDHEFVYPKGMDSVCDEYVNLRWCFVAVKTKVNQKNAADPRPGLRAVKNDLPDGASFDGFVQAMGFRFRTKTLVVPMRLSAFNPGDLRNIVYVLAEDPAKIRMIPEEYVVRQIPGERLYKNLVDPLPVRVIGGRPSDVPASRKRSLRKQRDPQPHNAVAGELFAADLLASATHELMTKHEVNEKQLQQISERLGLRGSPVDLRIAEVGQRDRSLVTRRVLRSLHRMTLTVVDGDFARQTIAKENLTFARYSMPRHRNSSLNYNARQMGPVPSKGGTLILGELRPESELETQIASNNAMPAGQDRARPVEGQDRRVKRTYDATAQSIWRYSHWLAIAIGAIAVCVFVARRYRHGIAAR